MSPHHKVIRTHKYVKVAFTHVIKDVGKMVVFYPDTRFAYADKTIERVSDNKNNLADMIDKIGDEQIPSWLLTKEGINKIKTANLEGLINNKDYFR